MESLVWLSKGFAWALQPANLLACFLGVFIGTAVGVLPGLGPTATMALLLPILMGFPPAQALVLLAAVYYGAMYGSSTTAILVNIPGEAASIMTAVDGYQLARQGRAGPALAVAAISSFVAAIIGLVGLVLFAPPLAEVALAFGPPEYFGLAVFSFCLIVGLSGKSLRKGLLAGLLGVLVSQIGLDPLTAVPRFTFGSSELLNGVDVVVACIGLFGVTEILSSVAETATQVYAKISKLYPSLAELRQVAGSMLRSAVTGFMPGLLPGFSFSSVSFISYEIERRISRVGHLFGTGRLEAVAAVEGANNAFVSGQFVTLFGLGLPTSPVMAMLLACAMIFGLQPGPRVFVEKPDVVWTIIASMFVGNLVCLILNLPLIGIWVRMLTIPYHYLAPAMLVVCFIGAYSVRNSIFDVWVMLVFGLLGYAMRKLSYPVAPMVMGMILGPMIETSYRQSLALMGSISPIGERPIAMGFLVIAGLYLVISLGLPYLRARRARKGTGR